MIDKFQKQIYIIDEFKVNMFLKFDILNFKKMIINYYRELLILFYCHKMTVTMTVILAKKKINRIIQFFIQTIVSAHFNIIIFIRLRNSQLLKNCNYMFLLY